MAERFAGSAADSERIVCCCFCTFPLAGLRERDLRDHPTDTHLMTHFHLPLEARAAITETNLLDFKLWLCQLHEGHRRARAPIKAFEQTMETELQYIENSLRAAREAVRKVRETYDAEVQRAIEETKSHCLAKFHCLTKWEPASGSLSSLIWNVNSNSPELFNIDFELPSPLRISIEPRIPSLAHCGLHIGPAQSELEQLRAENAVLRRELEAASSPIVQAAEPMAVQEAVRNEPAVNHEGDFEALQEASGEGNQQEGLNEVLRAPEESADNVEPAPHEAAKPVAPVFAVERIKREEGSELVDAQPRGRENAAVAVQMDEDAQPQFEQIAYQACMRLRAEGEGVPYVNGVVPKGLGWTECLGAHLGKFAEAEAVVNEAVRRQRELGHNRREELQAMEVKAALHFHRGQEDECLDACKVVAARYDPSISELHLTAVFFYATIASGEGADALEQERLVQQWVAAVPEDSNPVTMVLRTYVFGKIAFNKRDYWKAERHLTESQHLLDTVCSRPLLSAMNKFFLARVYCELRKNEKALKYHNEAEVLFSAVLSKSLWRAMNFNWMGEVMRNSKNNARAIEVKKKANDILEAFFPSNLYYAENLLELAELHEKKRYDEIHYREKARTAYSLHHSTDIKGLRNLTILGELYSERPCTFEKAKSLFIEANNLLVCEHPSSIEIGQNLLCLAKLYDKHGHVAEAKQFAGEAERELAPLGTQEAKEAIEEAERILGHESIAKRRRIEATSS